jgi:hypothetical protein
VKSGKVMAIELSQEDIVTNLLVSSDILKPKRNNFYISNPTMDTLGDYLLDSNCEQVSISLDEIKPQRYVFIR